VAVVGTGTDVGKTWVAARLLSDLRAAGLRVAARKPAQSYEPDDDPATRDAAVLGAASGERAEDVCAPHRWYETAMAPPMAAAALGRPPFGIADLVDELRWPGARDEPSSSVDVGLVETAGGVRSPLADDGDCLDLCRALMPDLVVLVADAGLGTINSVRLTIAALAAPRTSLAAPHAPPAPPAPHAPPAPPAPHAPPAPPAPHAPPAPPAPHAPPAPPAPHAPHASPPSPASVVVVLNRFDGGVDLHSRNLEWLRTRDALTVVTMPGAESALAELVAG
jgi:dethiobiotin synthetase